MTHSKPDGDKLAGVRTFRVTLRNRVNYRDEEGNPLHCGWYWTACRSDGSLPDFLPFGPFPAEAAAVRDAQGGAS